MWLHDKFLGWGADEENVSIISIKKSENPMIKKKVTKLVDS